jgi:predicted outer membrane repeat protein
MGVNFMKRWIIISFILVLAQIATATTIYVPSGSATIQAGIDAASEGDTVLVADGVYSGSGNRNIDFGGKSIKLISENGPKWTIIHCGGTSSSPQRGFQFINYEDTSSVVSGFTVRNGFGLDETGANRGGAIYCDRSSPLITNCIFKDNYGDHEGGAVATYGSSPVIRDCVFDGDSAYHGGAICFNGLLTKDGSDESSDRGVSNPFIENCSFFDNSANHFSGYGGAIFVQRNDISLTMKKCLFYDNVADVGGGLASYVDAHVYVDNCSFVDNTGQIGSNIYLRADGNIEVTNTIIAYGNNGQGLYTVNTDLFDISCSDIYDNAGGDWVDNLSSYFGVDGNISEDPLFCDTSTSDYNIQGYSLCSPYMNTECLLIGALEPGCNTMIEFPIAAYINYGTAAIDHTVYITEPEIFWSYIDTAATSQTHYEIEVGTDDDWTIAEMWSSGEIWLSDTSVVYAGSPLTRGETYYVRVRVNNGTIWGSWIEDYLTLSSYLIIRVPGYVSNIQEAIDLTSSGDTVLVAPGTYTGTGNRDLDYGGRNIVVISEEGPEFTIIDCEGSQSDPHRAFNFITGENSSAILEGFTITGGYGQFMDGYYIGGAVYLDNTTPIIKSCVFDQNNAESGGAIYCDNASPTFNECLFVTNTATIQGGAVESNNGAPTFNECEFSTNTATIQGGAVASINGSPTFNNCDFIGNGGGGKGGAIAGYDAISIMNVCTFDNNSALNGGAIHFDSFVGKRSSNVSLDSCLLFENISQTNGGAAFFGYNTSASLHNCTLADNQADVGSGIYTQSSDFLIVENCIIAYGISGEAIYCDEPGIPDITCSDIYGNFGGDWVGCISSLAGINFNFSDDPMFCDRITDDYRLNYPSSPCYNGNTPCNELVGALTIGCGGYICGDSNGDVAVNVSDAVWIIGYIFVGGDPPLPLESGDVNCDGVVNVSDAVWIINYVFIGGNEPCDPSGDGIPDC